MISCIPCLLRSSVCEVQWEAEFFSLQDNNNKLVAALREANANVEKWKKQLTGYQEEAERLRLRVRASDSIHFKYSVSRKLRKHHFLLYF